MAFTRVVGAGIHTAANINSHNIKSTGIVTATQFDGPFVNLNVTGVTTFAGSVSIGGTLTYEDVTNIDSVGLVTARDGIFLPDGKIAKFGNTAADPDLEIYHGGTNSIIKNSTGRLYIGANDITVSNRLLNETKATFNNNASVDLYYNGTKRFETTDTGAIVTGILTATNGLDAIGIQSGGVNISTGIITAVSYTHLTLPTTSCV